MAADEDLRPFVLQCDQCRTIVGDSFSLECAVRHLGAVVLSMVQMVDIEPPSMPGSAEAIMCAHCKTPLGEIPVARPEAELNGKYLIFLSATRAYTLGSAAPELAGPNGAVTAASPRHGVRVADSVPHAAGSQPQEDELVVIKMQQMLINHSERIASLEAQLERRTADRGGGSSDKHASKKGRRPGH